MDVVLLAVKETSEVIQTGAGGIRYVTADDLTGRFTPISLTDTTINLTTLNAVTSSLACTGCTTIEAIVTLGTAVTPPQFQIQGSQDNISFYNLGASFAGVASSTVISGISGTLPKYVRLKVSTIGVTLGTGYSLTIIAG